MVEKWLHDFFTPRFHPPHPLSTMCEKYLFWYRRASVIVIMIVTKRYDNIYRSETVMGKKVKEQRIKSVIKEY